MKRLETTGVYSSHRNPDDLAEALLATEDVITISAPGNDFITIRFGDEQKRVTLNGLTISYAIAKDILSRSIFQVMAIYVG